MGTLFRFAVRRSRGRVLGWGLAMALLGFTAAPLYAPLRFKQKALEEMMREMPPRLLELFGGADYLFTPEGYLTGHIFAILPLILGIFAVLTGSGLVAADEEAGRLDLLLAHPVARRTLYVARVLAWLLALAAVLLVAWLSLVLPMAIWPIGVGPLEALLPYVSLAGSLIFFGALALLLSQILPSRRLAAGTAGVLLLVSYLLTGLARLNAVFAHLAWISPLTWYQSGSAMRGLRVLPLLVLLGVSLVLFALGAWRFERRDVRLAGEGGSTQRRVRRSAPRPAVAPEAGR